MEHYDPPASPTQIPASYVKYHHAYFPPADVELMSEKQRGKSSINPEKLAQQACGFIEVVGVRIGFPRKTIATAQTLYFRFHLFFPRKDFNYHDVTMACLFVSSKMHDTLKKPRDILMVAYAARFPELAARSKAVGGEVEMDPVTVEQDRQRLLAVERLVLETICFNFTVKTPFRYVIKIARELKASKRLTRFAWRLAVDSSRTPVPLEFPPHAIAISCIYLAAILSTHLDQRSSPPSSDDSSCISDQEVAVLLGQRGGWERKYQTYVEDIQEICHMVIDLLMQAAQNSSVNTSPSTPASPAPHIPPRNQPPASSHPAPYTPDQLLQVKIHLREIEYPPRLRGQAANNPGNPEGSTKIPADSSGLGQNEGTVRFMFGPARVVGNAV